MTDHHQDADETPTGPATQRSPTRLASWWPVVAPAIALIVGLLIGGVVMGVANDGDTPSRSQQGADSPSAGATTGAPTGEPTTVEVPADCLAAVDTVDQLTELTREAVGAIRDFQPQELRDLLARLEKLDAQARRQAQACREVKVGGSAGGE